MCIHVHVVHVSSWGKNMYISAGPPKGPQKARAIEILEDSGSNFLLLLWLLCNYNGSNGNTEGHSLLSAPPGLMELQATVCCVHTFHMGVCLRVFSQPLPPFI